MLQSVSNKLLLAIMYVFMYYMIGKGQIAQKDHTGAQVGLRAKLGVNISI